MASHLRVISWLLFTALLSVIFPVKAQDLPAAAPTLTVDLGAPTHPISPYIYGINFAAESLAEEVALPVSRWGGNATTRYNYLNDTSNHASDWYFENLTNDNENPGDLPDGSSSDKFIEQNIRTGTATILTIPMIGWTPKSRERACGFSIEKYGPQQDNDWEWFDDCGNGIKPNGQEITNNDPADTSQAINHTFVQAWMGHLIGKYGNANSGGVRFYNLDNEPSLWNETHRDVYPDPLGYDESRDLTYEYAAAIKETDPGAQTLGPVEYGWTAYFYSAKDWEPGGPWWENPTDRLAHGDIPFVEWYLQQMADYEQQNGTRILDYFDLHYYPAAPGVTLSSAGDSNTQALRLRSTRSLWDETYIDESWIGTDVGEAVYLIPRMQAWVDDNYPGTKRAITEYNWGGLEHVNGALAQADVLGIFGREGLDLATLWDGPEAGQPGEYAFRMYLNYDGQGGKFGDVSVQAASSAQGKLSVYAARRSSDNALTLVMINKTANDITTSAQITGSLAATIGHVYRYSTANLSSIVQGADVTLNSGSFTTTYPANSITLIAFESDIASVHLLENSGFEAKGATNKLAQYWNPVGLDNDRRVCLNTLYPSNKGKCTFRFKGMEGVISQVVQAVKNTGAAGDTLNLNAFVSGKNLVSGARLKLKVDYADGTTATPVKLPLDPGTYPYQQITMPPLILDKAAKKIRVLVQMNGTGNFTVDDVSLTLTPNAALMPLPGASSDLRAN